MTTQPLARAGQSIGVGKDNDDKWKAKPPRPHCRRTDDLTWTFSDCDSWTLHLPADVFDGELNPTGNGPGQFTATVKDTAAPGPHDYSGACDGQPIHGNSPPGIIIDG